MGVNLGVESPRSRAEFPLKFSNSSTVSAERLIRESTLRSKGVSGRPGTTEHTLPRSLKGPRPVLILVWMADSDVHIANDRLKWTAVGDGQFLSRRMSK